MHSAAPGRTLIRSSDSRDETRCDMADCRDRKSTAWRTEKITAYEAAVVADYDARTAVERELLLRLASRGARGGSFQSRSIFSRFNPTSSANAGRGPGAGECAALDAAMERSAVEALAGEEPAPLILIDGKRRRTWTGLRHDLCCGAARPSAIGMLVSRVVGSITPTTTGQRACPLYLSSESGVFGSHLSRLTGG